MRQRFHPTSAFINVVFTLGFWELKYLFSTQNPLTIDRPYTSHFRINFEDRNNSYLDVGKCWSRLLGYDAFLPRTDFIFTKLTQAKESRTVNGDGRLVGRAQFNLARNQFNLARNQLYPKRHRPKLVRLGTCFLLKAALVSLLMIRLQKHHLIIYAKGSPEYPTQSNSRTVEVEWVTYDESIETSSTLE